METIQPKKERKEREQHLQAMKHRDEPAKTMTVIPPQSIHDENNAEHHELRGASLSENHVNDAIHDAKTMGSEVPKETIGAIEEKQNDVALDADEHEKKSFHAKITGFIKSIGRWIKNLFGKSNKEKPNDNQEE